jgi:hypothetical protein
MQKLVVLLDIGLRVGLLGKVDFDLASKKVFGLI